MAPKPTEVRLVASLVDAEYEDAETAARAVLEALEDKRSKDDVWVGVAVLPIGIDSYVKVGRGPFSTKKQAEKDAARLASAGPDPGTFFAVKLQKGEA